MAQPSLKPSERSPILAQRGNLTGAASGRAARFQALDDMIRRRQMLKQAQAGSPGGKVTPRGIAPTADEMQEMIQPGSTKKRGA